MKPIFALPLVVFACGVAACGGGDGDSKSSAATSTGQAPGSTNGQSRAAKPSGDQSGKTQSSTAPAGSHSGSSPGNSPGARAPNRSSASLKKSLLRYLARTHRQGPWYPLLRRLAISGGHVSVYLDVSATEDSEEPPVMACSAVLSYGRQVKSVTVYSLPTSQGKQFAIKRC